MLPVTILTPASQQRSELQNNTKTGFWNASETDTRPFIDIFQPSINPENAQYTTDNRRNIFSVTYYPPSGLRLDLTHRILAPER